MSTQFEHMQLRPLLTGGVTTKEEVEAAAPQEKETERYESLAVEFPGLVYLDRIEGFSGEASKVRRSLAAVSGGRSEYDVELPTDEDLFEGIEEMERARTAMTELDA